MKEKAKNKNEKDTKPEVPPKVVDAKCTDRDCNVHGNLKTRGRFFKGTVIKKFHKRLTIEFERMIYVRKYERYAKSKTKIHARLPACLQDKIQVGDYIKIQECRPLSKIIHFIVLGKVDKEKVKKETTK